MYYLSTTTALKFEEVKKSFSGRVAVNGITLEVRVGEIVALLGPNGSGKTTSLRMAAGLMKPDSGRVTVFGEPAGSEKAKRSVGYLPEDAGLYDRLTGWENLLFYAMVLFGINKKARETAELGAKLSGLGKDIHRPAGVMSKGMKRRVALARTLMIGAPLLLLDEPTSGLDVFSAVEVRNTVKEYSIRTGAAVVISSHNMLEVERLCDRVVLMHHGKIVEQGKPREIIEKYGAGDLEEAFVEIIKRR